MKVERLLNPRLSRIVLYRHAEEKARAAPDRSRDELLLYVAVEALNLWTQFCKSYVLCAARGMTSSSGALWKSPSAGQWSAEQVRVHLVRNLGRGRKNPANPLDEPIWRKLDVVERCCANLRIGNSASLVLALGFGSSFTSELVDVRNFAAHKCEDTRLKLDQIAARRGYPGKADLAKVMLAPSSSGYGSVLLEWLAEMERTMRAMCA